MWIFQNVWYHPQMTHLNRNGRKPVFTEASALNMLKNRIILAGDGLTVQAFIDMMVREGELPRPVSYSTMTRLLKGELFPFLVDPKTGERFDYSQVPAERPGSRPHYNREVDPVTGEPRRPMTRIRKRLMEDTLREISRAIEHRLASALVEIDSKVQSEVTERLARFDAKLEAALKELRAPRGSDNP